jgi:PAT family beta-lactamase induction signal transducer AmpG
MLTTQLLVMIFIYILGTLNPTKDLGLMAAISVLVAFFSATQDIAADAYRREFLNFEQLGLGSSFNMYGYRIAMLLSGGIGIGLVGSDFLPLSWGQLYTLMSACMLIGILTTLLAPEPEVQGLEKKSLKSAVVEPFIELFKRDGAIFILLFVFLYKLGDALSGALLNPFYIEMGFSNADIGLIAKTFGMMSSLLGLFIGGISIYRFGIFRCLWIFGILQGLSTAAFALLTHTGAQPWALGCVVIFEDITAGLGSSAFIAYISALTNKKFTATQYAILSSIATLGRNFFSGFSGYMVKALGWAPFFLTCGLIAIPGLLMLAQINRSQIFLNNHDE